MEINQRPAPDAERKHRGLARGVHGFELVGESARLAVNALWSDELVRWLGAER